MSLNADDYRNATDGVGPHAFTWRDKPHRLLFDALNEIATLNDELRHTRDLYNRLLSEQSGMYRKERAAEIAMARAHGLVRIVVDKLEEAAGSSVWDDPHAEAKRIARYARKQAELMGFSGGSAQ